MGQLKEVKQWREKKGGISAIYREEGRRMGSLAPSFSQRPSGLLEPNKCGRKKSKLADAGGGEERSRLLQKLQQLGVSGTFVRSWIH